MMAAIEGENDEGKTTFTTIIDKVSFVNKIPLLAKATSNDEKPTPGYMYQEINNLSMASGSYCQALLDYLVDRLDKDSCHVKLKVLRILQFVVQHGHPDFRHGLRRRSRGIKEATTFNGPPDPLHGNTPYQMVRKTAQELSSQLFSVAEDEKSVPLQNPPVMKTSVGMGASSYGRGKYEGFGSTPNKSPKTLGGSLVSGLRDLADRVVDYSRDPQVTLENHTGQKFGNYSPAQLVPSVEISPRSTENVAHLVGIKHQSMKVMPTQKIKEHKPGVAGGGWDDDDEEEEVGLNNSKSSQSKSVSSGHSAKETTEMLDIKADEICPEAQLIEEFIHGDAPIPCRSEVSAFMKRCTKLNCEKVVVILNDMLLKVPETEAMRGLVSLEMLLRIDAVNLDHLALSCQPALSHLYTVSNAAVKSKTRKIIRILEKLILNPGILKGILPEIQYKKGDTVVKDTELMTKKQCFIMHSSTDDDASSWNELRIPFAMPSACENFSQTSTSSMKDINSSSNQETIQKDKETLTKLNSNISFQSNFDFING